MERSNNRSKLSSIDSPHVQRALRDSCPICGAVKSRPCRNRNGRPLRFRLVHYARCSFKRQAV